MRRAAVAAALVSVDNGTLQSRLAPDGVPFDFSVTDTTYWVVGGHRAGPTDFRAGQRIYVLTRGLSGSGFTARAVADSPAGVILARAQLSRTVRGIIEAVSPDEHLLTLRLRSGALRTIAYSAVTTVTAHSLPADLPDLRSGRTAVVRLARGPAGEEYASRIALDPPGRNSRVPRRPAIPR